MEFSLSVLSGLSICYFVTYVNADEWSYSSESTWPGACRIGVAQSPINIDTSRVLEDHHGVHIRGHLKLRGYDNVPMEAFNNGHTLKWRVKSEQRPVLSGGPLRGNYSLLQFHFHWLSEHAIDSFKFPLEIHFVHIKTGLSVEQALEVPDGLAVIGVLYQVDNLLHSEFALRQLMHTVPFLLEKTEPRPVGNININDLLSPHRHSYFTYHGSLTTPNCQESVTWILMEKPVYMTDAQYKLLTRANVGGAHNYRSLQTFNGVVYRSSAMTLTPIPDWNWLAKVLYQIKQFKVNLIKKLFFG